jgi:hypothetical protein
MPQYLTLLGPCFSAAAICLSRLLSVLNVCVCVCVCVCAIACEHRLVALVNATPPGYCRMVITGIEILVSENSAINWTDWGCEPLALWSPVVTVDVACFNVDKLTEQMCVVCWFPQQITDYFPGWSLLGAPSVCWGVWIFIYFIHII